MPLELTPEQLTAIEKHITDLPPGTREQAAFQQFAGEPLQRVWRDAWLKTRIQKQPVQE